jgi:DNA-binding CsgD family transcriptional regulator
MRPLREGKFIRSALSHVSNIFDKLGVSSRTGAAAWAYQHNLM